MVYPAIHDRGKWKGGYKAFSSTFSPLSLFHPPSPKCTLTDPHTTSLSRFGSHHHYRIIHDQSSGGLQEILLVKDSFYFDTQVVPGWALKSSVAWAGSVTRPSGYIGLLNFENVLAQAGFRL